MRIDEMPHGAAGHRRDAGPVNEPLPAIGPVVAVAHGATTSGDVCRTLSRPRSRHGHSRAPGRPARSASISPAAASSFFRTSAQAARLAAPIETVVRPPPTPTSKPAASVSAARTMTSSGRRPSWSATICGRDCTIVPEPISTPAVTSVALPSAFKLIVAADGPTKMNQVPTVVRACRRAGRRPGAASTALDRATASIRSSIGPSTSPSKTWPVAPRSPSPSTLRRRNSSGSKPIAVADFVGMALQRESVVDAVASAESAVGRRVGVDGAADELDRAEPVVAAERVRRHRRQKDLLAAIGAAVHQHDRLAPDDLAFGGDGGANADFGILAAEAGQHLLLPGDFQTHRPARLARQNRRERLDARIEFQAEPAADRAAR